MTWKRIKQKFKELICEIFGHKFEGKPFYYFLGWTQTCSRCHLTYVFSSKPVKKRSKLKKFICNWGRNHGLK